MIFLLSFLFAYAWAEQVLTCREVRGELRVTAVLRGESRPVPEVSGTIEVRGLWKPNSRLGRGISWEAYERVPEAEDELATITVFFGDKADPSINYDISFAKEDLGRARKNLRASLWTDPRAPEGGAYPSELICRSVIRR